VPWVQGSVPSWASSQAMFLDIVCASDTTTERTDGWLV
jgi:hypothetical protein